MSYEYNLFQPFANIKIELASLPSRSLLSVNMHNGYVAESWISKYFLLFVCSSVEKIFLPCHYSHNIFILAKWIVYLLEKNILGYLQYISLKVDHLFVISIERNRTALWSLLAPVTFRLFRYSMLCKYHAVMDRKCTKSSTHVSPTGRRIGRVNTCSVYYVNSHCYDWSW